MDQTLNARIEVLNNAFAVIFNLELIMKLYAMHWDYFSDTWNLVDCFIVVSVDLGMVTTLVLSRFIQTGVNLNNTLSVFRTIRIMRIVRIAKNLKDLRTLIETLVYVIPSFTSIATLLTLAI